MEVISYLARFGVLVIAGYFFWLGWICLFRRERAVAFLGLFASSAKAHFIEMGLRVLAGACLIGAAPRMLFGDAVYVFGLILIATSLVLILLPWRWHRAFAQRVIPGVFSRPTLLGACCFL
ncbi:MAG: hypothetical protein AB8G18_19370, partial [Gammaproteobacteria bacterium]